MVDSCTQAHLPQQQEPKILESFPELLVRELASAVRIARCRTSAWQHRRTGTVADECMLQSVRYAGTVGYGTSVLLRLFSGTAWAMNLLPIPGNHEAGKHGPVRLTPAHVLLINYQQLACRPPVGKTDRKK